MGSSNSPRILICRLSAVGDCILTMPLLCALRANYPQAFLAWVVQAGAAPLLRGHPCLDRLIVVKKGWLKSPRAVAQVRRELRSLGFDTSLDPQSLTKSAAAARLSGAGRRIGFAKPQGRELSTWLNNQLIQPRAAHVVDRQLELLKPLGVEAPDVRFGAPEDESARDSAAAFLDASHLSGGFAVINPGAGWDSKLWPAERFAEMARRLGQHCNTPSLVVWAGDREHGWARQIVAQAGGHAILAPPTSLLELAAVCRKAQLFVGSDTGPLHLAAAVGTPCVGLYGPTRPQDCGPYGPQHVALQAYYQGGTSRQRRRAGNDAMRAIPVESVWAACETVLQRRDGNPTATQAA